jgi:hypothetical protein
MIYVRLISVFLAAVSLGTPFARGDGPTAPAQEQPRALENPAAAVSLDQLAATRERPLFAPDRRRPAVAAVIKHVEEAPPPPPPEPPKLSLSGVIVDSDGPHALVRSESPNKTMQIRIGDDIAGWRVTKIEERRMVISHDTRLVAVTMFALHSEAHIAKIHPQDRILEVNADGVLRSHRIHKSQ